METQHAEQRAVEKLRLKWEAKKKRRETLQKKRDEITGLMIQILCSREGIMNAARDGCPLSVPTKVWQSNVQRMRDTLAECQLKLEKLMVNRLNLDHLRGVETVYGIKRRKLAWMEKGGEA